MDTGSSSIRAANDGLVAHAVKVRQGPGLRPSPLGPSKGTWQTWHLPALHTPLQANIFQVPLISSVFLWGLLCPCSSVSLNVSCLCSSPASHRLPPQPHPKTPSLSLSIAPWLWTTSGLAGPSSPDWLCPWPLHHTLSSSNPTPGPSFPTRPPSLMGQTEAQRGVLPHSKPLAPLLHL